MRNLLFSISDLMKQESLKEEKSFSSQVLWWFQVKWPEEVQKNMHGMV